MEHERLQGSSNGRDEGFWDFSWDEMAEYDLPAEIDYVLKTTGAQTLSYISHSQGTAQGFAAFSENPELARKVGVHVALAPVAFVGSTDSALFQVASYLPFLKEVATLPAVQSLGNTLLGTGVGANIVKSLVPGICNIFLGGCDSEKNPSDPHNELFDSGLMGNLFSLPDMTHLNQTRIPVYLSHLPEGTSVRNLLHWAQSVRTNKFQKVSLTLSLVPPAAAGVGQLTDRRSHRGAAPTTQSTTLAQRRTSRGTARRILPNTICWPTRSPRC